MEEKKAERFEVLEEKDLEKAKLMKEEGNEWFKQQKYLNAMDSYTQGLSTCPLTDETKELRAIFYSNRASCAIHLNRPEEAIEDASEAITLCPNYRKPYLRRATAFENVEKHEDALTDLNKALELDPSCATTRANQERVEKIVTEKTEKMKEEMMGKLKTFGNSILGKFGMSTENFQMVQDPNTGSYNINYKPQN